MRINQAFIHGFMGNSDKITNALTVVGDSESIRITKCEAFDEWLAETIGVVHPNLRDETPYNVMNRQLLHSLIDAWLDDVEFDG